MPTQKQILPRLYAIVDASLFPSNEALMLFVEELISAGISLLQYRDKLRHPRQVLDQAYEIERRVGDSVKLIMNDRADFCVAAGFDGLHVGQDDLSPDGARGVIGADRWLGISHSQSRTIERC